MCVRCKEGYAVPLQFSKYGTVATYVSLSRCLKKKNLIYDGHGRRARVKHVSERL